MAQANPWSLLDPKVIQALASKGALALQSGQISPDEAKAHAQSLGILPGDQSPEQMGQVQPQVPSISMANPTPSSPLDMGAAPAKKAMTLFDNLGPIGDRRGSKVQASESNNQSQKLATSTITSKSPEQYQNEMAMARSAAQPQQDAVDNLRAMLGLQASANSNRSLLNLSPLMALSDARQAETGRTGGALAGYTPPANENAQITAGTNELAQRQSDVQKAIYENMRYMKGGTVQEQLLNAIAAKSLGEQQNPVNDPNQMLQDRQAFMTHRQNMQAVKRDPILTDMVGRYSTVNNAISNLTNASNLTPQQFHESQNAIRTTLFPKGISSGVDERASNYIKNAGFNVDDIVQTLLGTPANIDQNDPDIKHIEGLAQNMKTNFVQNARKRLATVTGGGDWVYDDPRYAQLADSMNREMGNVMSQFTPTPNAQAGLNKRGAPGAVTPSTASAPKTRVQGGVTYTQNPQTGAWE